jgi:hypothetical protein
MIGKLRLTYEPDDERHGDLSVVAEAHGCRAQGTGWISCSDLVRFRDDLSRYPLSYEQPVSISSDENDFGLAFTTFGHVGLTITPVNTRGVLLVRVELTTDPVVSLDVELQQRAVLCFPTSYAAVDRFRAELGQALEGRGDALLEGVDA